MTWNQNYILSTVANNSTFAITDAKLYVPIVTLSIEDNVKLSKLLSDGFKRSVYWNKYKVIFDKKQIRPSIQGIKKLFFLAYSRKDNDVTEKRHRKYFLPRIKIENYNIEIDGRNFHDQPINDLIKQYDEIRKISTGQCDDYTTGCLLNFDYFEKKVQINCFWFE